MIVKGVPVRIVEDRSRHKATNGPLGVSITTGTRYFAATLAQEVYEGQRYMGWYWSGVLLFALLAGFIHPAFGVGALLWATLVGRHQLPTRANRERRELMGQAIEIAAIRKIYGRPDMLTEYRLQARSIIRVDSSYKQYRMFQGFDLDPNAYTNADIMAGATHPQVEAFILVLLSFDEAATKWVDANADWIIAAMPLGDDSHGY